MSGIMDINVGDTLILKKKHPCGGEKFAVLSVGSDIMIKCLFCGRVMSVARIKLEKNIKDVTHDESEI